MKVLGKRPTGKHLVRVEQSANYKNGFFQNLANTPPLREGASTFTITKDFFLKKKAADIKPPQAIPSVKTDLHSLPDLTPTIVWFGHSSYLIKHQGKNILVDPVFSGFASPISLFVKAFEGADAYGVEDMPFIDMLIITHDHYDHLDYDTVLGLKDKIGHIYTTLGVGAHLDLWGFDLQKISEFDWWQSKQVSETIKLTATPARHFSGRDLERSKTLWASFVLEWGPYKLFIGGDSGYDEQFKVIGEKFGAFDIAFLECGQYNKDWPLIHMFPEQTAQAAKDLNTKVLFPVHWGKFILSDHAWNGSIKRVQIAAQILEVKLTTPQIGEAISLPQYLPNNKWWHP